MQERIEPSRRSDDDDPYRVGILTEAEVAPKREFLTLKEQVSRDLWRTGCGFMVTAMLLFAAATLGINGTTGSYWGDWELCWQSYLPFHLAVLSALFTAWSFVRALITAMVMKWRI